MPTRPKNIILYAVLSIVFWGGVGAIIILLRPEGTYTFLFFYLILFTALFVTTFLLFGTMRRALLGTIGITAFLILRMFSLDTIMNVSLLAGFLLMIELYFWKW